MNIAIIGYGKMGKEIEKAIIAEGIHSIGLIISKENKGDLNAQNLADIDVAIDFTQPDAAYDNVMTCFDANTPIVVGTTAWQEGYQKAKKYCDEHDKSMLVSSNFSIGVLIFSKITKQLAKLMSSQPQYDVSMEEIHHTEKKDAPSGTALHLANDIIQNSNQQYTNWHFGVEKIDNSIPIDAIRQPNVPGTHKISYSSPEDTITMIHTANNRKGFAIGAIKAAEFLYGKTGAFTMDDLL